VLSLLVDAAVLIDIFNAVDPAPAFARDQPASAMGLHPVVEAEVFAGARSRQDLRLLIGTMSILPRVRVTTEDFDHAIAFVCRYRLSHGVGWPDCLIAATAMRLGLPVATTNVKHFRTIRGLKVVRPY